MIQIELDEQKNLGYVNGWVGTPEVIKECREKGHKPKSSTVSRCVTKVHCDECNYFYKVDSGD